MKLFTRFMLVVALVAFGAFVAAYAQTISQIAEIPVGFYVDKIYMPPGKYIISERSQSIYVLQNDDQPSKSAVVHMPLPVDSAVATGPHIALKTYGTGRFVVAKVWSAGATRTQGRYLTRLQRNADQAAPPSDVLLVPLRILHK
jgi:hypothetical protein